MLHWEQWESRQARLTHEREAASNICTADILSQSMHSETAACTKEEGEGGLCGSGTWRYHPASADKERTRWNGWINRPSTDKGWGRGLLNDKKSLLGDIHTHAHGASHCTYSVREMMHSRNRTYTVTELARQGSVWACAVYVFATPCPSECCCCCLSVQPSFRQQNR